MTTQAAKDAAVAVYQAALGPATATRDSNLIAAGNAALVAAQAVVVSASTSPAGESPDPTEGARVQDEAGVVWTIDAGTNICRNGTPVFGWRGSVFYWKARALYTIGSSGKWWALDRATGGATQVADPRSATPPAPTPQPPAPVPPASSGSITVAKTERDTINIAKSTCSDALVVLWNRAQDSEYFGAGYLFDGHFYARLDGVKGRAPRVRVLTASGVFLSPWQPCWTYTPGNPDSWTWVPFTMNPAYAEFQLPQATQGTIYVASHPVMRGSDWDAVYVFNAGAPMTIAQVDELGQSIPPQPLRSMKFGTGSKRIVLMAGQHGYEDLGDLTLRGALNLIASNPAARAAATWFVYPQSNPAGRYGGHWRGGWEPGKPLLDTNRHWTDAAPLDCTAKLRTLILAQTGGQIDALWDAHCNDNVGGGYSMYGGGSAISDFASRYSYAGVDPLISDQGGMAAYWAVSRGAKLGLCSEINWCDNGGPMTAAKAGSYGAAIAQAIVAMIGAGKL